MTTLNRSLFICAVDGPAGSGKSSVGKIVAEKLDWSFVSTGSFYRALALHVDKTGVDLNDTHKVTQEAAHIVPRMIWDFEEGEIVIDNIAYGNICHSEKAGKLASHIAKISQVRDLLLPVQRRLATATTKSGVIIEGRDVGTVVFPDAHLKIFFTASLEERARRRTRELETSDADKVLSEMRDRDTQDTSRKSAPLAKAQDAVEIDTSSLSLSGAAEIFLKEVSKRLL